MKKKIIAPERIEGKSEAAIKNKIGEMVRYYRKDAKMSQEQLGGEVGLSTKSISNMETGKYMPGLENLLKIRNVLGIPWEAFDSLDDLAAAASKNSALRHCCYAAETYLSKEDQDFIVHFMEQMIKRLSVKEKDTGEG